MKATFVERTDLTDVIASFSFRPEQDFSFTAGQYIELTLTGHTEDGKPAKRWFTISSSPTEELLTITTRVGGDHRTPFKRALRSMEPGTTVDISEPMGDFVLPKLLQTPLLFVAGGIGATPLRSILQYVADTGEQRPINVIHAVKTEDEIIFQDTYDAAEQHVTVVVEKPSAAWGGVRGQLDAERIIGIAEPSEDTLIYLTGPEPFVQALYKDLRRAGVPHQLIVLDEFQGYSGI